MNSTVKTVLFWLLIGVSALLLWEVVKNARDGQIDQELNLTQFMSDVDQNNIREIEVYGMEVRGKHRDGTQFHTTAPTNYFTTEMLTNLHDKGVLIKFRERSLGLPLIVIFSLTLGFIGGFAVARRPAASASLPPELSKKKLPVMYPLELWAFGAVLLALAIAGVVTYMSPRTPEVFSSVVVDPE